MRTLSAALETDQATSERASRQSTRREFLAAGASAITLAATRVGRAERRALNVGIVGAGLAGLVTAEQLAVKGIRATIYEAASRVGGRCSSLRGFFPGQTAELGGEFLDNPHKTL